MNYYFQYFVILTLFIYGCATTNKRNYILASNEIIAVIAIRALYTIGCIHTKGDREHI